MYFNPPAIRRHALQVSEKATVESITCQERWDDGTFHTLILGNFYGKLKTVSQMVFSILIMIMAELHDFGILPETFPLQIVSNALLGVTAVLCVISGVIYVKQSIKIIDFSK